MRRNYGYPNLVYSPSTVLGARGLPHRLPGRGLTSGRRQGQARGLGEDAMKGREERGNMFDYRKSLHRKRVKIWSSGLLCVAALIYLSPFAYLPTYLPLHPMPINSAGTAIRCMHSSISDAIYMHISLGRRGV